jgi:uncharacterized phiE125 gp8 family phage protein
MYLTRLTAPDTEPLSLDEVKEFCRIDDSDSDLLLDSFIKTAIELVENTTGKRLISQKWRMDLEKFGIEIKIPYPPLASIDSIDYYDTANILQTLSVEEYEVHGIGNIGLVLPTYGYSFPSVYPREKAVQVSFTCGYSNASQMPEALKNAIKTLVYYMYDSRGKSVDQTFLNILLGPYIMRGFGE